MNKKFSRFIDVTVISLFILSFLILIVIMIGSIYYLFGNNETLIAGFIAFLGSIIGGLFTLFGVRYTIAENKKEEEIRNIPQKVSYLRAESYYLFKLQLTYESHKLNDEEDCRNIRSKYEEFLDKNKSSELFFFNKKLLNEYQKISDLIGELSLYFMFYNSTGNEEKMSEEYLARVKELHPLIENFREQVERECKILLAKFYR